MLGHNLDVKADLDIPDADGIAKCIQLNIESQFHDEGDCYHCCCCCAAEVDAAALMLLRHG